MKIEIASVTGFCAGVERAMELVENALKNGPFPVRVLHEIVHNEHVVESFRKRGVLFFEELDSDWSGGTLILSAHGVSKQVEEQAKHMSVTLVDATCPLVKQIHRKVEKLEKDGYSILFVGNPGHRETEGVAGRLNRPPAVIAAPEDAEAVPVDPTRKYACLTQTTLSADDCSVIFEILKRRIPGIEIFSGICRATSDRQSAVKRLAEHCSGILVIGSERSSNSKRLKEVAEAAGAEAILVSEAEEIPDSFLTRHERIGIAAGASAPEELTEQAVRYLQSRGRLKV